MNIKRAKCIISIRRGGMNIMKRSLNLNKLATKNITTISSKEALKDVIPFEWSEEVLNGTKKIAVSAKNKQ
ncbi:hypothetical protein EJM73_09545 [Clostridium botulinum]|uniref:hypothetical protein n=1 Tax=Clostridium botulinum TaxID=1491 RepID=UPI001389DAF0|nr:hypothetical protein [Clostridium botulinum]NCI19869.1 hypothetical protein [Clostridium botulinum]NCI35907.1 hypothetical protein [Clostridium botulinum]NCI71764.1 hypothetical protein [Clostridium botulinum]NDI38680.1 hypothetical protein [Clostridium botulinum]